jgi:hypothetical protein
LGEALAAQDLTVTEVSAGGSVPELMVINRGHGAVLLIDGEELAGAKQNRVLNTSILVKEVSETKIPVSCTEQGRWSYTSKQFSTSGNIMAHKSRSRKSSSVALCLESLGSYSSDQGEVWAGIAELQAKAGAKSPTSAMSDVYKSRDEDLRNCDEVFKRVPNQVGLLAFIGGEAAGLDTVSRTDAYSQLHSKLVRSYVLEGLLELKKASSSPETITAGAREFLDDLFLLAAEETEFPSVGYGTDHRFKGKNLVGSALVHENEVIHAAFFHLNEAEHPDRMTRYLSRRFFRE